MTSRRRTATLLFLAAFLFSGNAGQAQAAGYRYWSFWERDGNQWTYATQGPSTARPSDGDVQGFRFAVSEDSGDATKPRGTADFATICANTPAQDGRKRIALVIDFGTTTDAPSGETPPPARTACVPTTPDATTAEALAAVAKPLRYSTNALLCAIAGYPEAGCGEQVEGKQPTAAPKKNTEDRGPSLGLLAGTAAVAALGAAAVWQARRRRNG
ncbi:SCO2322 family protein [Streptomyces sp. NBC_01373]|uniref:SCO2322 family protein n=1 Tax=Streptomyces sp. NBC_01373 TaxID=2903843 RepID=UPI00225BF86A|nr:SCO2322 family protein [Streptomyces sp. NBC_01373]MCX4701156.1 SCO2322 family protein [Streptomyces sp. NBC_01373]